MLTLRQFQPIDVQPILSGGRFASLETQDGQAAHDTSTANRAAAPNGDILRIIYLVMKKSLDFSGRADPDRILSHKYLWLRLDYMTDSDPDWRVF